MYAAKGRKYLVMKSTHTRVLSLLLSASLLLPHMGAAACAMEEQTGGGTLCQHHTSHTAECGYESGAQGQPCGFACNIWQPLKVQDSGAATIAITAFDKLDEAVQNQSVPAGTPLEELKLPATLGVSAYTVTADTASPGAEQDSHEAAALTIEGVAWKLDPKNEINDGGSVYNPEGGFYCFTPVLPDGYAVMDGVSLPEIAVQVGAAALTLQDDVLTVEFNSNGSGGESSQNNDMKTAIEAALGSGDETTVTTIKLTGDATEITRYNWYYLICLYYEISGWTNLKSLDLSSMIRLKDIKNGTGFITSPLVQLHTLKLPANLQQIGEYAFYGCKNLALQTLPAGVTKIGDSTFFGCKNLALQALPSGITKIGGAAFYGCTNLTLQALPSGVTEIGNSTFEDCKNLALQALPSGVTKIGDFAFRGCTSLANIIMEPKTAPTLGREAFDNTSENLTFYVPKGGESYNESNWGSLKKEIYIPTTSLSLNINKLTLYTNATPSTGTLTAELKPEDAVPLVRWESSKPDVATVDGNGKVTAKKDGTTTITATSLQGGKTNTCTVTVKSIGKDATLKILSLTSGTLEPGFRPDTGTYTATVDNSVTSVTITAKTTDSNATVIGDGTKTLSVGSNTYTVTVTAEDGTTQKSYTITITREEAPYIPPSGGGNNSNSGNDSGNNSGGSNSGGGSSDSGSSGGIISPSKPTAPSTDTPATGEITTGKPDKNGAVSVTVKQITDALKKARQAAIRQNRGKNGVALRLNLQNGVTTITLDRATLNKLITSGAKSFTLDFGGAVSMTFDQAALKEIRRQSNGTVSFTAAKANLSGNALSVIGTHPAFDLNISYRKNNETVSLSTVGNISVAFPYTPIAAEQSGGLRAVYVDNGQAAYWLTKSAYDPIQKAMIFEASSFGVYGVGCKTEPFPKKGQ